jgi:CRP-like cAMP-binding protein
MTLKIHWEAVPIFQFLDKDELARLATLGKEISKSKGDAVLMHGENVPGIYIVGEGACGVYPQGALKPLVQIEAGGSFGEMSFLEKSKASATIRAEATPTKLVFFQHTELHKLTDDDAKVGRSMYRGVALTLSQKLRVTNQRISKELKEGQQHLETLSGQRSDSPPLENLERIIIEEAENMQKRLTAGIAVIDDLSRKIPEKAGTLTDLSIKLGELNQKNKAFTPQLLNQVKIMVKFVKSMTEFLTWSGHE